MRTTLIRTAAMAMATLLLSGCLAAIPIQNAIDPTTIVYQYDDIAPGLQGRWKGTFKNIASGKSKAVTLDLQRETITNIQYSSDLCTGRLKYQRTQAVSRFTYLEQIEYNPKRKCARNSYVEVTPNGNGSMSYKRYNMQGKRVDEGVVFRR